MAEIVLPPVTANEYDIMLNNLSQQIRGCLEHAQECARRARIEGNPSITRGFLDMERCWRGLARSYAFAESLDAFSKHNKKRQEDATSVLEQMARKITDED